MTGLHHRLRASSVPEVVYTATDSGSAIGDIQNFINVPIGPASADRLIVVVVLSRSGTARSLSSLSIGGAATIVADSGSANRTASIGQRLVTSGETVDIVATFSGDVTECAIIVYAVTKLNSTTALDGDAVALTTDPGVTLTSATDAVVIAGAVTNASASGALTWGSSLIEDEDDGFGTIFVTAAHKYSAGTSTGVTTSTGVNSAVLAAATWR